MVWAEGFAGGIGGAAGELFGFGKFAQAGEVAGEVVTGFKSGGVLGAADFLG